MKMLGLQVLFLKAWLFCDHRWEVLKVFSFTLPVGWLRRPRAVGITHPTEVEPPRLTQGLSTALLCSELSNNPRVSRRAVDVCLLPGGTEA